MTTNFHPKNTKNREIAEIDTVSREGGFFFGPKKCVIQSLVSNGHH